MRTYIFIFLIFTISIVLLDCVTIIPFVPLYSLYEQPVQAFLPVPTRSGVVLFTTEDSYNNVTREKLYSFRTLANVYSAHYRLHCVVFSNNTDVISLFQRSSCSILRNYARNPYGLPIITSLYSIVGSRYSAKYYGYVNADILMTPELFSVLDFLDAKARSNSIPEAHELACRVTPMHLGVLPPLHSSIASVNAFFNVAKRKATKLRNPNSAVRTVFMFHA